VNLFSGDGDDRLLVDQVLTGRQEFFALLVERHEKEVFGMGMSFFHNREEAADFAQDVFIKVYRNLSQFEGRARFSTWLYKVAYNTALNSVTRRKEYVSLADDFENGKESAAQNGICGAAQGTMTPEREALRTAAKEAVRTAVRELPDRYRVCIDLFFFYDRSLKEIEAITGYPINTIKSHVRRAKKLLKERLADYAYES
jgi:RNA polymerase sigma-70 factor (ECF subfamily)